MMFFIPAIQHRNENHFNNSFPCWIERPDYRVESSANTLTEKDGLWEISIDVPGVSRDQLSIAIDGRKVTVSSTDNAPRQYVSSFVLPAEIDPQASEAKLENGVLSLKLARKAKENTSTTLTIK